MKINCNSDKIKDLCEKLTTFGKYPSLLGQKALPKGTFEFDDHLEEDRIFGCILYKQPGQKPYIFFEYNYLRHSPSECKAARIPLTDRPVHGFTEIEAIYDRIYNEFLMNVIFAKTNHRHKTATGERRTTYSIQDLIFYGAE